MKILVVDDDDTCNKFLSLFLRDEGFEVESAMCALEASKIAQKFEPNVMIADWLLKDGTDGVQLARELYGRSKNLGMIFTTGSPAEQLMDQLDGLPIIKVFEKPINLDELLVELQRAQTLRESAIAV